MSTKKINRRKFLIMAGAASSAAILAACAPQTQATEVPAPPAIPATEVPAPTAVPATEVPAPTAVPATEVPAPTAVPAIIPLEMMMTGEDNDKVHQTAISTFKVAHPELDLTVSPVPGGFTELLAKVNARVAAGNPPDMVQVSSYGPCITWAKKKLMLDLKTFTSVDPAFKDNPVPEKLLTYFTQAGVLYGMPKDYVTHAVIYNKALLDQAGVEAPKDGWTWADLVEKAQKLTSGTGIDKIFGWRSPTTQWWYESYMLADDGPGFFDRRKWDFTKPTADNPKNAEALQWLYDTINKYKISPSPEQLQSQDSSSRQLSGKLAMWSSNTIETVALLQNQDKIDWHVVPLPRAYPNGPSTTMVWTSGFGIFSASKNPKESWEFVKHMSIGAGAVVLGVTGFSIPSGRPDAFLTPDMVARGGQVFLDVTKSDVPTNDSLGEYASEIGSQVINPTSEAFFLGKITSSEMMQQIQKGMEDILAANPA
jgi:multiple sugar transport system substrate-binding protein